MNDLFQQGIIISASRRTDIPRFYSTWFANRIKEGFVIVRNPFNPKQIKRVSLAPEDVSAVVFWTRDATPMENFLPDFLPRYRVVFLWTITGYGRDLEPAGIEIEESILKFLTISKIVGADKIAWRYDPIIITEKYSPLWHINNFSRISAALKGITKRVIVSLITPYSSVKKRLTRAGIDFLPEPLIRRDVAEMLRQISDIARTNGQKIQACCQAGALAPYGIPDGACIDSGWLSKIFDRDFIYQKDRGQRGNCLCTKSVDIGAYDTCPAGCLYCYAVKNPVRAKKFFAEFDQKNSPGLFIANEPASNPNPNASR